MIILFVIAVRKNFLSITRPLKDGCMALMKLRLFLHHLHFDKDVVRHGL